MLPCARVASTNAAATTTAGAATRANNSGRGLAITYAMEELSPQTRPTNSSGGLHMYFRKGTIRSLAILAVAVTSALAIATSASAGGSTQQIYNDYAKDGQ